MSPWIETELAESQMHDVRHAKRLAHLLERLSEQAASSIPRACHGWAETVAAYRFLDNPQVGLKEILSGHQYATVRAFFALCARRGNLLRACGRVSHLLVGFSHRVVWRRNLLHARGQVGVEFQLQGADEHAVHPIRADDKEHFHDLLVVEMALQGRKGRVLD